MNSLLTAQEVSELLRYPVRTIYKFVRDKQLPAIKIGSLRFRREDVQAFIDEHATKQSAITKPTTNRGTQAINRALGR